MPRLSVVIPTYRRAAALRRALRATLGQTGLAPGSFEIVIVDNCPDRSAESVVKPMTEAWPERIRYLVEPAAGISHARNTGVQAARAELIVFLDDDNEPTPTCLASLLRTQRECDADAVFGPVEARLGTAPVRHAELLQGCFSRRVSLPDGADATSHVGYLGTGNSLFRRSTCFAGRSQPFASSRGLTGGEDTLLLRQLAMEGRRFYWSREAVAYEHVEPSRQCLSYLCRRRFRSGQVRAETCILLTPPRRLETVLWMGVGAGQVLIWGLVAAVAGIARSALMPRAVCAACAGLGKVFWMKPFQSAIYAGARPQLPSGAFLGEQPGVVESRKS